MKLYIREIIIETDEKEIEGYNFCNTVNIVCGRQIYSVINFLLGIQEPVRSTENVRFFAVVELEQTYYIRGKKDKGDAIFTAHVYKENEEGARCTEYFDLVAQKSAIILGLVTTTS